MGIFTRDKTPKIKQLFTDEQITDMEDQLKLDVDAWKEGRKEDFVLLQGLRGNWSVDQFVSVAQQRGKSWRFVSAMADKALEIQGMTMLSFVSLSAQEAFTLASAEKTVLALEKLWKFRREFDRRNGTQDHPIINHIFGDAEEQLMNINRDAPLRLTHRLNNLED